MKKIFAIILLTLPAAFLMSSCQPDKEEAPGSSSQETPPIVSQFRRWFLLPSMRKVPQRKAPLRLEKTPPRKLSLSKAARLCLRRNKTFSSS